MSKGGITKKLEDTLKALDEKQLKKALYLTENNPKLERQHQFIEGAARICLANRDNRKACEQAINEAREKVHSTVSLPLDDTSLEGLEQYLTPNVPVSEPEVKEQGQVQEIQVIPNGFLDKAQKTDDELFEECEECHVAVAASKFADICAEKPEEAGGCELIGRSLENENTEPVDWLKAMVETAEKAQGKAKEEMVGAITKLTDYLERRNSPFLKALEQEGGDGEVS
jgi:hypothetical protein